MTTLTGGHHEGIPVWTVADRLRKAREYAGLDQTRLAAIIDVSRNTVGNYELGRVRPRRLVVRQWALATGVPLTWLMEGAENPGGPGKPPGKGRPTPKGRGGSYPRRESNPRPSAYECVGYSLSDAA